MGWFSDFAAGVSGYAADRFKQNAQIELQEKERAKATALEDDRYNKRLRQSAMLEPPKQRQRIDYSTGKPQQITEDWNLNPDMSGGSFKESSSVPIPGKRLRPEVVIEGGDKVTYEVTQDALGNVSRKEIGRGPAHTPRAGSSVSQEYRDRAEAARDKRGVQTEVRSRMSAMLSGAPKAGVDAVGGEKTSEYTGKKSVIGNGIPDRLEYLREQAAEYGITDAATLSEAQLQKRLRSALEGEVSGTAKEATKEPPAQSEEATVDALVAAGKLTPKTAPDGKKYAQYNGRWFEL